MKGFLYIVAAVMLASSVNAHPRNARSSFDLLKKGRNLSAKDARSGEKDHTDITFGNTLR